MLAKSDVASTIWLRGVSAVLVVCGVMHYLIIAPHPVKQTPRALAMIDFRVSMG